MVLRWPIKKGNCAILASYFENLLNGGECFKSRFSFNQVHTQYPDSFSPNKHETIAIIVCLEDNTAPGEDSIIAEV